MRKLRCGNLITSLDQLYRCSYVIVHEKPYHHGWVAAWQLRMAMLYIERKAAYEGIRITNSEYYPKITIVQALDRHGDEIHAICPFHADGLSSSPQSVCEGQYCQEAFERWKEMPVG